MIQTGVLRKYHLDKEFIKTKENMSDSVSKYYENLEHQEWMDARALEAKEKANQSRFTRLRSFISTLFNH